MNKDNISVKDVLESIVPITRFNKGEATLLSFVGCFNTGKINKRNI